MGITDFSLCFYIGNSLSCAFSGIFHHLLLLSLGTWVIILLFCLIVTSCALNSNVHPESQSLTTEKRELYVRLGMMWTSHDYSGKTSKSSIHEFLVCMVCPFVHPIWMGDPIFVDGQCGSSTCK